VGSLTTTFSSVARSAFESGKVAKALTEHLYFVEKIKRLEARKHVALQSETKRNHCDYDRHAHNDTHGGQRCAQFRLPQIPKGQMKDVEETHVVGRCFVLCSLSFVLCIFFFALFFVLCSCDCLQCLGVALRTLIDPRN